MKSIHAVSKPRVHSLGGHARGDDRVHQPRAVHVQPQARVLGDVDHRAHLLERPHAPAGDVRRLLDGHEPRAWGVAVARRAAARPRAWPRRTSRRARPAGAARRPRSPPARRPRSAAGGRCGAAAPRRRPAGCAAESRSRCTSCRWAGRPRPRSRAARRRARTARSRSGRRTTARRRPRPRPSPCASPASAASGCRSTDSPGHGPRPYRAAMLRRLSEATVGIARPPMSASSTWAPGRSTAPTRRRSRRMPASGASARWRRGGATRSSSWRPRTGCSRCSCATRTRTGRE